MSLIKYVPGVRVGRLLILSRVGTAITCRCDCGSETIVFVSNLARRHTTSCGCLRTETTVARSTRHGFAGRGRHTPTYQAWCGMIKRCENPESKDWPNYGGRGIAVCERWRQDFQNFLTDMGERPSPSHSLDRIKNELGYEPGNVRWATRQEQNSNTRRNRLLTHDGRTQTLTAWASESGLHHVTIIRRLKRGLPVADALRVCP